MKTTRLIWNLVAVATILCATSTAQAQEPRTIEGVPCEVCVSEATVDGWESEVERLRKAAAEARAERDQAVGRADEMRRRVDDMNVIMTELRRQNAKQAVRLENQPSRLRWFGVGAATTGVAVLILFIAL